MNFKNLSVTDEKMLRDFLTSRGKSQEDMDKDMSKAVGRIQRFINEVVKPYDVYDFVVLSASLVAASAALNKLANEVLEQEKVGKH